LRGINDTSPVYFLGCFRRLPFHGFDRVGAEQLPFYGVFERVGDDGAVSLCCPSRRGLSVKQRSRGVEHATHYIRIGERRNGAGVAR
jgi:hypothetical protein